MTDEPWDDTATRTLCAQDPHLEGMRQMLLKLESDAHWRGWDHPDNQHKRMIYLVCRDGNYWAVMRRRGSEPVAVVTKPESLNLETGGNVPYALGRVVDSIVGNPVPVPSRTMRG